MWRSNICFRLICFPGPFFQCANIVDEILPRVVLKKTDGPPGLVERNDLAGPGEEGHPALSLQSGIQNQFNLFQFFHDDILIMDTCAQEDEMDDIQLTNKLMSSNFGFLS